jgi:hypothetical protein
MSCCAPAILSLRAECSIIPSAGDLAVPRTPWLLCRVALLRFRAVFLRSRSRFGLAALATGISRTGS